jgi:histidine triad (HIT) family protein
MFATARKIAQDLGVAQKGYRTVFNVNAEAGQTVFHLHLHVIGGRRLSWP